MLGVFHMQKLVDEQKAHEPNPLYAVGDVTKQIDTHSVSILQSQ
jgi:hypothetical protein